MKHPDDARLNDYADGLLEAAGGEEVAAHLERCKACETQVERIRALTAELAALPREITPGRDLRPPSPARRRPATPSRPAAPSRQPTRPWLRAAAVVALIVAGAAIARVVSAPDPATDHAPALATEDAAGLVPADAYANATRALRSVVEAHRDDVPEEASLLVDRNLEAVEGAIRELEQASARLPGDPDLARMLDQQYRTRLELLRSAVALVEG